MHPENKAKAQAERQQGHVWPSNALQQYEKLIKAIFTTVEYPVDYSGPPLLPLLISNSYLVAI